MLNQYLRNSLLLFFLFFTFTTYAQLKGDTYAAAKSKGAAHWVFTYSEAPGFATKEDGKLSGITFDLMNAFKSYVEQQKHIEVEITYDYGASLDFKMFMKEVKDAQGGVFGLTSATITAERKRVYNFSPPYIVNISMILSHKSVPTLNNIEEISSKFAGMTAVTVQNSTNAKLLEEVKAKYFPALVIEYAPSTRVAMETIAKDPKKFTNVDFSYYFEAVQNGADVKRHPAGDTDTEQFGIIMPKSNDWAPVLEEFMSTDFLTSTQYKKILADNLGPSAMKFFETLKSK